MKKNFYNISMEMDLKNITTEELQKLQELVSKEIYKREEREKAKGKIYELLKRIDKLCTDNNFSLYHPNKYNDDYDICLSDILII